VSETFPHLFTPIEIGGVTVPNRLLVTAHSTQFQTTDPSGFNRWSVFSDRAVRYHAERAKGGFGLIVAGQTQVHPASGIQRPGAYPDAAREVFRRLADAVHAHGSKVFLQLNQNGREKGSSGPDSWEPVRGASSVPLPWQTRRGEQPKQMDEEDIAELIEAFADTAVRAREAGLDGVEVHMAHNHLLADWFMPLSNKRTDRYGGSAENRLRLTLEVVDAVRAAVGRDYVVGVRMNAVWDVPGGVPLEDGVEVGRRLAATGLVDFLNVSGSPIFGTIGSPHGSLLSACAAVKAVAGGVPVFGVERIVDPREAERALAEGQVDMVAMTRASIADPELPAKAREGRLDEIRVCIGASQGCLARNLEPAPMTCSQNPAVGYEEQWGIGTLTPAATPRTVLVAGGGPAGLEAAVTAAARGHRVVLCERAATLGGQVDLIRRSPRRDDFRLVVEWRERELARLGVEVRLETEATPALVAELAPDAVVVATGSRPRLTGPDPAQPHLDAIPGADGPNVFSPADVLTGRLDDARHVVVVDGTGYHQSADPAEYLAVRGARVSAVSAAPVFAGGVVYNDLPAMTAVLRDGDVDFHLSCLVRRIDARTMRLHHTLTGRDYELADVDAVVLALGAEVEDALYRELRGNGLELHRIGDCVAPRGVEHAIHEGHAVGRAL
jgi:2,4-dienoyl-CoA reductase-like NADH-dependent reductase (Old Yellow Enzyme family)/thioredoxin reductase